MRIALLGFRATGKSLIGSLLARRLGLPFVDLDQYISQKSGQKIAEIVKQGGWEAFRKLEKEALRRFARENKPLVLALGGGAVLHEEEMDLLAQRAFIIWLTARPETILERLEKDQKTASQRPHLTDKSLEEEVREVLTQRTPLYQRFADLSLATDRLSPEEIVQKIVAHLWQTKGEKACQR